MSVLYKRPSAEEYSKAVPWVKRIFTISSSFFVVIVSVVVTGSPIRVGSDSVITGSSAGDPSTGAFVVVVIVFSVVVVFVFIVFTSFKEVLII